MNTFTIKMKFLITFCIMLALATACQKGDDSVNPAAPITRLVIHNFNPNTWDLRYNGEPASNFNTQFKILGGAAQITLVNKETGEADFDGAFEIRNGDDTLYLFQPVPGQVSLFRNNQAQEPKKEGYIKVKLAYFNTKEFAGLPVNVVFRHVIGMNWDTFENIYSERQDTLFNVGQAFGETYKEIPLNIDEIISDVNPATFELVFLDKNNQPVLKDGKPFIASFDAGLNWEIDTKGPYAGTSICTSYITDEDTWDTGAYWQMYSVNLFAD